MKLRKVLLMVFATIAFAACSTDVEMLLPRGPQGKQGEKGDPGLDGLTPYIKDGNWWIGDSDMGVRAIGIDGDDGKAGDVPYIFKGYWYINGRNTGVPARGKDGKDGEDGLSAYELWLKVGNCGTMEDFLNSLKGSDGEDGKDGLTPYIKNGYWWIGDHNTHVKAKGEKGEDGKDGDKGEKGESAYDLWKKSVASGLENPRRDMYTGRYWPKSRTSLNDFYDYLTGIDGEDGKDGQDGEDGLTPYIKDGYWWIGNKNTGVKAAGKDGKDGEDGITPRIKNGYWWIGDRNTGVQAEGEDGEDGETPRIKNGYWWIGNHNTGVQAIGEDGLSAYELWVEMLYDELVVNTRRDLYPDYDLWPLNHTSQRDFYDYLSGIDGRNGDPGKDGKDAPYFNIMDRIVHAYFPNNTGNTIMVQSSVDWVLKATESYNPNQIKIADYILLETVPTGVYWKVIKWPDAGIIFELKFEYKQGNQYKMETVVILLHENYYD